MYGIVSQNPRNFVAQAQDILDSSRVNSGGVGLTLTGVATPSAPVSSPPKELFDISALSGLRESDKYLGKNRVSDIKEVYQTYLSGNPIGKGGQYVTDAAKKYGVSIYEAARGYLLGAGLNIIPSAITQTTDTGTTGTGSGTGTGTGTGTTETKNPFEVLADILPSLFGNAVYNPPLQTQAYGYTPTATEQPLTQSGGSSIGTFILLGVVGVVGYFIYKRFAK